MPQSYLRFSPKPDDPEEVILHKYLLATPAGLTGTTLQCLKVMRLPTAIADLDPNPDLQQLQQAIDRSLPQLRATIEEIERIALRHGLNGELNMARKNIQAIDPSSSPMFRSKVEAAIVEDRDRSSIIYDFIEEA